MTNSSRNSVSGIRQLAAIGLASLLVACGGGGGSGGGTPTPTGPSISVQPQNITVNDGQAASFSVTATGPSALSYQWQRNGVDIAGATSATYSLSAVVYPDNGAQFRVTVTAAGSGNITSNVGTLTVNPIAPAITTAPASVSVAAGAMATFMVTATGSAPLRYQWSKRAAGSTTTLPIVDATGSRYVNTNSQLADDGAQFSVVVTNGAGQTVNSPAATLTVQSVAPFIVLQPQPQSVVEPASATFVVVAGGTSPLTYQWQRNGANIAGATNASYTTPATTVAGDNGAQFSVVVSRAGSSSVTSSNALLTVTASAVAPSITAHPQPISIAVGGTAIFNVTATGTTPLSYQWYRNGVAVVGATNASYTLSPVSQLDNQASFSVIVNNVTGIPVTSTAALLTVTTPSGGLDVLAGELGGAGNLDGTVGSARFALPYGIGVDAGGFVYVADTYNSSIRKVSPTGVVSTLAGNPGKPGAEDGTGTTARFNYPTGLTVDAAGNVYVVDTWNFTVRAISSTGVVSTLAGTAGVRGSTDGVGATASFGPAEAIALDGAGNLYVADSGNDAIRKIDIATRTVTTLAGTAGASGSADGTGAAARFRHPGGIAVDGSGNVYVSDTDNHTIRMITAAGVVTTIAGTAGASGQVDGTGVAARFDTPRGVVVDSAGNLFVVDNQGGTIRRIAPGGIVTTLAGSAYSHDYADGTGTVARFAFPAGLALDTAGNLYVADVSNDVIRKVSAAAVVTTLAGKAPVAGSADGTGASARFTAPQGVAIDAAGSMYIADTGNNTIRSVTSFGVVTTLAGTAGVSGSSDGTGAAAQFNSPRGMAADSAGNVYIADTGNSTIRRITAGGVVTTLAGTAGSTGSADGTGAVARFSAPQAVATDSSGNVYVADTANSTIRKITPAGVVTTLAGSAGVTGTADGPGSTARFNRPEGIVVDAAGNVYVADTGNWSIRRIDPSGAVSTFAGVTGTAGFADGTGNTALFDVPRGMTIDSAGNLYVLDSNYKRIRKITPTAVVTTVAGTQGAVGVMLGELPASTNGPVALAVLPGTPVKLVVPDAGENSVLLMTLP